MTENWLVDLNASARKFVDVVWPKIQSPWFDGGEIAPVEAVSEEDFADQLDQLAGIDYWVVKSDEGMRGIASRVQDFRDMSTFTVRYERESGVDTEYQKRKQALENDYLRPYWTIQAYVWNGKLDNAAIARTDDLIRYINRGELGSHYGTNGTRARGAAKFYHVHWEDLGKYHDIRYLRDANNKFKFDPDTDPQNRQSNLIDF